MQLPRHECTSATLNQSFDDAGPRPRLWKKRWIEDTSGQTPAPQCQRDMPAVGGEVADTWRDQRTEVAPRRAAPACITVNELKVIAPPARRQPMMDPGTRVPAQIAVRVSCRPCAAAPRRSSTAPIPPTAGAKPAKSGAGISTQY